MISLGLSAKEQALFHQGLRESHQIRCRVYVVDLNGAHVEDVSDTFQDGQVNFDAYADFHRDLSLTLLSRSFLSFETGSPTVGINFAQLQVRVLYGVYSDAYPEWVWVPVFTGPITDFSRDEDTVSITAVSKEKLHRKAKWLAKTYLKGTRMVDIVRDLVWLNGEKDYILPEWTAKVAKPTPINAGTDVWAFLLSCKKTWPKGVMTFDGWGRFKLFALNNSVRWIFKSGPGGDVKSKPKITYTMSDEFCNACRVIGAIPAKAKSPVVATYVAPASHPMSPQSLSRAGRSQFFGKEIRDDNVTTYARAAEIAKQTVEEGLVVSTSVEMETLGIPHLELWDLVRIKTDQLDAPFRLMKFSLSLSTGMMTVGYNSRISKWKKRRK